MNLNRQTLLPLANFGDIRYINARRVSPSNGEMRLCVYNATHLASAMEINKFISAALGLVRFLFRLSNWPNSPDFGKSRNVAKNFRTKPGRPCVL